MYYPQKSIIISGVTASGKSSVCDKLLQEYPIVAINCDSKQIYKEIPITTAQPTDKKLYKLYGYVSVTNNYSVELWLQDCKSELMQIKPNFHSLIIGGSGLYITSLTKGLSLLPKIEPETKEYVRDLLKNLGPKAFYELLIEKDPLVQTKIHFNDTYRLTRAYEVIEQTGTSIFSWYHNKSKPMLDNFTIFLLLPPRSLIYDKINHRFLEMIKNGLIDEVKHLMSMNLNPDLPAMKAHGIPEIIQYLQQKITLNVAIEKAVQNIRNYAKRQYTWFKHQFPNAIVAQDEQELLNNIVTIINN